MKRICRKIEDMMTAIAFAEAGEFETATEILKESESKEQSSAKTDRLPEETVMPLRTCDSVRHKGE
ncbi:MAG: hypothetical protein AB1797_02775 [bacterium]